MSWKDDFPVLGIDGKVPSQIETKSTRPGHTYEPLVGSDDFKGKLKNYWQWNHEPDHEFCSLDNEKDAIAYKLIRYVKMLQKRLTA